MFFKNPKYMGIYYILAIFFLQRQLKLSMYIRTQGKILVKLSTLQVFPHNKYYLPDPKKKDFTMYMAISLEFG